MKFTKDEIRSSMLLYAVTDRMWLKEGESLVDVAEKVLQNGATFLQIREKDLDEESFEEESEKLKALCNAYHVPFVVNDSVEIALQCGADGVHVGQSDIKGRDIRAIIGPDKILGISAGTVEQAVAAEQRCSPPAPRRTQSPWRRSCCGASAILFLSPWWPSAASTRAIS